MCILQSFFSHFLITNNISLDIKCQQMDIVVQYLEFYVILNLYCGYIEN